MVKYRENVEGCSSSWCRAKLCEVSIRVMYVNPSDNTEGAMIKTLKSEGTTPGVLNEGSVALVKCELMTVNVEPCRWKERWYEQKQPS